MSIYSCAESDVGLFNVQKNLEKNKQTNKQKQTNKKQYKTKQNNQVKIYLKQKRKENHQILSQE